MAAAKKRRVVARLTLICGDPDNPTRIQPGAEVDLPEAEAESLVQRKLADWHKPPAPAADAAEDSDTDGDADA